MTKHSTSIVFAGLKEWAGRNNDRVARNKCQTYQQLGMHLREYVARGAITKLASNSRTLYMLSEKAINASVAAKTNEQEVVAMNDF